MELSYFTTRKLPKSASVAEKKTVDNYPKEHLDRAIITVSARAA